MCTVVQYCLAPPCVAVQVEFDCCWVDLGCSNALFALCLYGRLETIESS